MEAADWMGPSQGRQNWEAASVGESGETFRRWFQRILGLGYKAVDSKETRQISIIRD